MRLSEKKRRLKWVARIHFFIMVFSFVGYLAMGFFLGPEFLSSDIRKKLGVFADDTIIVTAVVPGPPAEPVVTATPACVAGVSRIVLNWGDDIGTTTWDVERDSAPLTSGLVVSGYTDTAVTGGIGYSYVVTATGPMSPGTAVSDPVTATALDCTIIAPVTVTIETLGGKNVTTDRSDVTISKARPKVTGTSNTPDAIIDIAFSDPAVSVRMVANGNGYFEWTPPISLSQGSHIIRVTATDPMDNSRTGTDSFIFWTDYPNEEAEADEDSGSPTPETSTETAFPTSPDPLGDTDSGSQSGGDFDFSVRVNNGGNTLFQEDELSISLVSEEGDFPEGAVANIFVDDGQGRNILRLSGDVRLGGRSIVVIEKEIPLYIDAGKYSVRADVTALGETKSRYATFLLRGLPLLSIGGRDVSYAEVASIFGTLFFSSFFLFVFFLLFFVREYWLTLHRLRGITGRQLARLGFIVTRKGVM